jgi:hypothetical protein
MTGVPKNTAPSLAELGAGMRKVSGITHSEIYLQPYPD